MGGFWVFSWKRLLGAAVVLGTSLGAAGQAQAQNETNFLVLGVIASEDVSAGVALVKDTVSGKTFAARPGMRLSERATIVGVTQKFVSVKFGDRTEEIAVGDQIVSSGSNGGGDTARGQVLVGEAGGVERSGNVVRVAASYRDAVLKGQLSKVLMQVAAVPHYVNGALEGFKLWDIDAGSIFEQAGFAEGDLVTSINGQALSDVGATIKLLQSMREEPRADITVVRKGVEQTLQIVVQ
jgi:general secretion pathway protein C